MFRAEVETSSKMILPPSDLEGSFYCYLNPVESKTDEKNSHAGNRTRAAAVRTPNPNH